MTGSWPYAALAAVIGIPCAFWFGALLPALAGAVIATNLALSVAFHLWGDEADA